MDIRQCKRCDKLFQFISKPICPACCDEIDRMFLKVRDHLYTHPEATIEEISEKTEVPEKQILDFLREERLSLRTLSGYLTCIQCGKPIGQGQYCDACKEQLSKALLQTKAEQASVAEEKKLPSSTKKDGKMHINYSR